MYKNYLAQTYKLGHNIVCACCGCISHDITEFEVVLPSYDRLRHPETVDIPFDFSSGIDVLDQNRILIDKLGITQDKRIHLCRTCHGQLSKDRMPSEALANFRWIGPVPEQLRDLTWIEELLIARIHVCGSVVRLGQRNNPSSFFGIKGHVVFLPQDTTRLIDLLPMSPSALSDLVKVVWTGRSKPDRSRLRSRFTVRKHKVYDALKWLVDNHEDYKKNVTIDEDMMAAWEPTFVAVELLDNIGHVSDPSAEDASRDGFGMDDPDDDETTNDETGNDLPFTSSGVVDVNNIAEIRDATTLTRLAQLKADITANVVTGTQILHQYDCDTYFTSAFPTIFPYGTGKHRDSRRGDKQLPLLKWVSLMLQHSSRFLFLVFLRLTVRRFQAHPAFVVSSFDISRLNHNSLKTNVLARRKTWPATALLLESLTPEQLMEAASQAEKHQPITDPAIQELLKGVARVGSTASGSDERKSYMLAQLKSSIVHFGCPAIFLTINPHERYSPIALFYAGEEIDIRKFQPKWYALSQRLKRTLNNPLAVVEYFHNMIRAIIENVLKAGIFGEVSHYYATIEYQGRGTPHTHLAVRYFWKLLS